MTEKDITFDSKGLAKYRQVIAVLKASGDSKPIDSYRFRKDLYDDLDGVAESLRKKFINCTLIKGVDGKMKVVLKKKYRELGAPPAP